jgi:hypothetical protein
MTKFCRCVAVVAICPTLLSACSDNDGEKVREYLEKKRVGFVRESDKPGAPIIAASIGGQRDLRVTSANELAMKLAVFKQIKVLTIWPSDITDDGLKVLASLPRLEVLRMYDCEGITDAALKEIARAKRLGKVRIEQANIVGTGLGELSALKQLEELNLRGCPISDKSAELLRALPRLTVLELASTRLSDAGVMKLAELKELRLLSLADVDLTDAGLKAIGTLKALSCLDLSSTKMTDRGLKELYQLQELTTLRLFHTNVTEDGVAALRNALPDCTVYGP